MALIRVRLGVPSIHCPTCVTHIETLLQPPSVSPGSVAVSVLDHSVAFDLWLDEADYPTAQTRLASVLAILREGGYETESVETRRAPVDAPRRSSTSSSRTQASVGKTRDNDKHATALDDQLRLLSHLSFRYGGDDDGNDGKDGEAKVGGGPPSLYQRLFRPRHAQRLREREQKRQEQRDRWQRHIEACEACRSQTDAGVARQQRESETSRPQERYHVEVSIGGMTCASCAANVKTAAEHVAGVLEISVEVIGGRATATVDSEAAAGSLAEAIEDAGYEVSLSKVVPLTADKSNGEDEEKAHRHAREPSQWQTIFSIHGMTCASCVGNVAKLVESDKHELCPEGVELASFEVSLFQNSAVAVFRVEQQSQKEEDDANAVRIASEKVAETIEDAGYDCSISDIAKCREKQGHAQRSGEQRTLDVVLEGMFCQYCVDKVRRHIEQQVDSGLLICDLDRLSLSHPRLTLTYTPDPPSVTVRSILDGLNGIDPNTIQARLAPSFGSDANSSSASERFARRELRLLLIRLALAFLFVPPTLLIAVLVPTFLPRQHSLRRSLSMPTWGRTTRADIILWALATPVQSGVGSIFYARAFKSLRTTWSRRGNRSWIDRTLRWGDMNVLVALGTSVAYFASLVFLFVDASMSAPKDGMMDMGDSMLYFDTSVFLVFFILLGRVLEAWSKRKTTSDVAALGALRPTSGLLIVDQAGSTTTALQTRTVDVSLFEIGDEVLVPVGSSPPLDGVVVGAEDAPEFDESALTGESRGVPKANEDVVYAGTAHIGSPSASTSSSAPCRVRITARAGSCVVDGLVDAVRAAASKRAPLQAIADTLVGYFVPAIVGLSILVLCVWCIVLYAPTGVNVPGHEDGERNRFLYALQFAVSVLVVACPCGIGLAVPAAQMAGVGVASRHGVLARGGGPALARAAKYASSSRARTASRAMVFDKTGTITRGGGGAVVEEARFLGQGKAEQGDWQDRQEDVWDVVRSVEGCSTHPVAQTVAAWCSSQLETRSSEQAGRATVDGSSVQEVTGRGIKAEIVASATKPRSTIYIGSARFMEEEVYKGGDQGGDMAKEQVEAVVQRWQGQGGSVVFVGIAEQSSSATTARGARLLALFHVSDSLRPEAKEVLALLRRQYLGKDPESTWVVSGDAPATVEGVAGRVGVQPHCAVGGVMPLDKAKWVQRLQHGLSQANGNLDIERQSTDADHASEDPKKTALVAFVGDGINDAPALASADLSIALGSGSVLASTTADFVLLTSEEPLVGILTILSLAKRTHFTMLAGFAWACAFNVALIPLAAGVLVPTGFTLGPSWSGLAMALSSCSVVLNALTLRLWTPPRRESVP